jgi:NAD(P)H-quinone oxidoreductase subunit 5
MISPLTWLIGLAPLLLALAGLAAGLRTVSGRLGATLAIGAAAAALACTAAAALAVAVLGPLRSGVVGWNGVGFGVYLDALSAIMAVLVAFVGLIVIGFSRNYLDGEPGHGRFTRGLCLTLAAVLTLIVSGDLLQLWLAWIATSLCLHTLLLFHPERRAAVLAARKKFVSSRLGDLCVLGAMILVYRAVGSLDYAAIFAAADALRSAHAAPGALQAAAGLLVVAALLKSAQAPLHGWLTEVMETPTPVSALLHAGVINAGGFLVLRFASVIALSPGALDLLVVVGGLTALFASLVMLTQTSVKVSLAWSTIAQMGFMMLECGLGAFSAALLHIVAHSLYKAHAFLSSGGVIDLARASWTPGPGAGTHPLRTVAAVALVLLAAAGGGAAFGASLAAKPGVFALGAVLLLGLTHLVTQALDARPNLSVLARTTGLAVVVAVAYFALQAGAERLTAGALPAVAALRGPFDLAAVVFVVGAFALVTVLQGLLPGRAGSRRWLALHTHLANGLYLNTLANRLALRLWPGPARAQGARR